MTVNAILRKREGVDPDALPHKVQIVCIELRQSEVQSVFVSIELGSCDAAYGEPVEHMRLARWRLMDAALYKWALSKDEVMISLRFTGQSGGGVDGTLRDYRWLNVRVSRGDGNVRSRYSVSLTQGFGASTWCIQVCCRGAHHRHSHEARIYPHSFLSLIKWLGESPTGKQLRKLVHQHVPSSVHVS